MQLLDLPLEIFHEILGWAVAVRGIKRGLRLRLVNKIFATELIVSLAQFKLLDTVFPVAQAQPPPAIEAAYLERRILNERPDGAPHLVWIRRVAKQLSQETEDGRDEYDYIRQLCPLVVDTMGWPSRRCSVYEFGWTLEQHCSETECDDRGFCGDHLFEDDVFVAALYTRTLPVAARCIASGKRGRELTAVSYFFGGSQPHAVTYGNRDILAAMLDETLMVYWFHMMRGASLTLAAEAGNMDLMQFIWDFKAVEHPWACAGGSTLSNTSTITMLITPSRAIFDWIMEKRRTFVPEIKLGKDHFTFFLIQSAHRGWVDMVAYYLACGAPVDGSSLHYASKRPLLGAVMNGHKEVVKVLLDHGANTGFGVLEYAVTYGHFEIFYLLLEHGAETGKALAEAVARGYRNIVDALLERGGHTKEELQSLLPRAIEIEDKVLFRNIAKRVTIDDATRAACAKVVEENGLDSMAELL